VTSSEPTCSCVVENAPHNANTTSIIKCPVHGDHDELAPLPGQGLNFCVLLGKGDQVSGIFTNTNEGIGEVCQLANYLGYTVLGTYAMSSLSDLRAMAASTRTGELPPIGTSKPPRGFVQQQEHEPGCKFADQGHPGKCYLGQATYISGVDIQEHTEPVRIVDAGGRR
jgi:hypothetical protein